MKSVLILLLAALVLLLPVSWGAAAVEGPLQGNVRWSGAVELTGPVTVPAAARLEIAPGTLIRVTGKDSLLRVLGGLEIAGTAQAPVHIDSPPGWAGILVERARAPVTVRHLRVAGAATALLLDGAQAVLDGGQFTDCEVAVRAVREARLEVTRALFAGNGVGVDLELKARALVAESSFSGHREAALRAVNNCQARVTRNLFRDNHQGAVLLQKFPGEVTGNRFLGNGTALVLQRTGDGPRVRNNLFQGNDAGMRSTTFSRPELSDNRFLDNGTAVESDQFAAGDFVHNLFRGNDVALHHSRRAAPQVSRNVFQDNVVAIFCDYSSYPRVRDNNFSGNPLAVKLGDFQSAAGARPPGSGDEAAVRPAGMGPPSDLLARAAATEDFVDVTGNWWDESTATLAAAGEEGNLGIFFDRRDRSDVEYPDKNGMGGRVDWVRYHPWRPSPVPDAGPRREAPILQEDR